MKSQYLYQNTFGKNDDLHFWGCPYLSRDKTHYKRIKADPAVIYDCGYNFCQECSPIADEYLFNGKKIDALAKKHGMTLVQQDGVMAIITDFSEWLLVPLDKENLAIFHKSYFIDPDTEYEIEGFHFQTDSIETIPKAILYIINHDKFRKGVVEQKRAEKKRLNDLTSDAYARFLNKGHRH